MNIESFRRLAAQAGERGLVAAIDSATRKPTRTPADLLKECEKDAGISTASTEES